MLDVFIHSDAVYGLSIDPSNPGQFISASDNGSVQLWDTRYQNTDAVLIARSASAFHAVHHNPVEPRLIATANSKDGVALWDIRKPRIALLRYGGYFSTQSSMSVRFNEAGTSLLALRRRLPPVLYHLSSPHPVLEFDHTGYYNSCTMKSSSFCGEKDEYIMSGSDDFKIYIWKIPNYSLEEKGKWVNEAQLVLEGHRSIVNQVRYNKTYGMIASSGVEKIVKLWSMFKLQNGQGDLDEKCSQFTNNWRRSYSHEDYINLVMESGQAMTHDYTRKSVEEDPKMMAFFDSLVKRDMEGGTSDSDESSSDSDDSEICSEVQSSGSASPAMSRGTQITSSESDSEEPSPRFPAHDLESILTQETLTCIASLTSRVRAKFNALKSILTSSKLATSTPTDQTSANSNRIFELIAQKRNDQLLRAAQATLKMAKKRLLKTMKKQLADKNVHGLTQSIDANDTLEAEQRNLQSLLDSLNKVESNNQRDKDKRKKLRKTRGKILMGLSDSSDESNPPIITQAVANVEETRVEPGELRVEPMELVPSTSSANNGTTNQTTFKRFQKKPRQQYRSRDDDD